MELRYPLFIYIGVVVLAISFIITAFSFKKYKGGIKNTTSTHVKKMKYYRWLAIRYFLLKFIMTVSLMAAIVFALFIASKPTEVRTETFERHNRDIFICMDVSTSLDGVNIELCENLKTFVKKFKGERFGITMFNSTSMLVLPLSDDYDYVLEMIDKVEESIKAGTDVYYVSDVNDPEAYGFRFSGTIGGDRGSSLIGDGLLSCLYSFPDLDDEPDRSRMIVFVTDNDLMGEPIVSLNTACELCELRQVKVFALAPDIVVNEDSFSESIKGTKGGYYNTRDSKAMKQMLKDLDKTDVNVSYRTSTTEVDVPEKAIMWLVICICVYYVCARRIKL